MKPPFIPVATYRLQFNRDFTFAQAADLVPYLAELGVSHCYASPYLRARPGSTHGYDIIDHNSLNPEIGTPEDYERFVTALHEHGMAQILDIVPNHMGVMGSDNAWWLDVLENGQASIYADYFDIDWYPLKDELQGKVLVPVLGDQYGTVLDRGELRLTFEQERGEFSLYYYQHRFPINPREYPRILGRGINRLQQVLGPTTPDLLELESLISAFGHLPTRNETAPEQRGERLRDKEIHKRRLAALCARSPEIAKFLEENIGTMNGIAGEPRSFDELHELIKAQAYRLAYWRVAADDINYRRFFDVNDLAALRQENPAVFEDTHRLIFRLLVEGKISGLRVDHPDGLYDPAEYFRRLQKGTSVRADLGANSTFVLMEKILSGPERLPDGWPIFGTTGYEFANLVNGLFVDASGKAQMDRIYSAFIRHSVDFEKIVYESKKVVMHGALTSELNIMANRLSRIALAERHTCDFTVNSLREALSEIAACFPVYRTYISASQISPSDRKYIDEAVGCAKRRSAAADTTVFDFIREVLLTRQGEGRPDSYRRDVIDFAMKFQQFTSALMAKGLEDTSFYRFHRLISLNEVGGNPVRFGVFVEQFHSANLERSKNWPHTMLATSTHDTKRSEDVRVRIDVLSEVPSAWRKSARRWRDCNVSFKTQVDDGLCPSLNDEYFFYQTLVGAWSPGEQNATPEFCKRMQEYMLKAVREAKEKTSWANPNPEYERAVTGFVGSVLGTSRNEQFLADFIPFHQRVSRFGMINSLSQTLLKLTAPGLPDIYQGTELWDFSLVDPDNRRQVDYEKRRSILQRLHKRERDWPEKALALARQVARDMNDGSIKLFVISKTLKFRQRNRSLFDEGTYLPLKTDGAFAEHVITFARQYEENTLIVIVPRFCARIAWNRDNWPLDAGIWKDTRVEVSKAPCARTFTNVLTGETIRPDENGYLNLAEVMANFPLALLAGERR